VSKYDDYNDMNSHLRSFSSFPIGAVVGGSIGGLVAITAITTICILCCRRKKSALHLHNTTETPQQNMVDVAAPTLQHSITYSNRIHNNNQLPTRAIPEV
jgi:hypothetical protein